MLDLNFSMPKAAPLGQVAAPPDPEEERLRKLALIALRQRNVRTEQPAGFMDARPDRNPSEADYQQTPPSKSTIIDPNNLGSNPDLGPTMGPEAPPKMPYRLMTPPANFQPGSEETPPVTTGLDSTGKTDPTEEAIRASKMEQAGAPAQAPAAKHPATGLSADRRSQISHGLEDIGNAWDPSYFDPIVWSRHGIQQLHGPGKQRVDFSEERGQIRDELTQSDADMINQSGMGITVKPGDSFSKIAKIFPSIATALRTRQAQEFQQNKFNATEADKKRSMKEGAITHFENYPAVRNVATLGADLDRIETGLSSGDTNQQKTAMIQLYSTASGDKRISDADRSFALQPLGGWPKLQAQIEKGLLNKIPDSMIQSGLSSVQNMREAIPKAKARYAKEFSTRHSSTLGMQPQELEDLLNGQFKGGAAATGVNDSNPAPSAQGKPKGAMSIYEGPDGQQYQGAPGVDLSKYPGWKEVK